MPRVSREQQALHRQHILDASSELFRRDGIAATSVADLMGAAGLTHGGFYGHFESKEALATEVCARAFEASAQRWRQRAARAEGDRPLARRTLVEGYLSQAARDRPGTGCPATTLAADAAHAGAGAPLRSTYAEGLEGLLAVLEDLSGPATGGLPRRRALVTLSTLVGAQMLARGTAGLPLSDEFLEAARQALAAELPRQR